MQSWVNADYVGATFNQTLNKKKINKKTPTSSN